MCCGRARQVCTRLQQAVDASDMDVAAQLKEEELLTLPVVSRVMHLLATLDTSALPAASFRKARSEPLPPPPPRATPVRARSAKRLPKVEPRITVLASPAASSDGSPRESAKGASREMRQSLDERIAKAGTPAMDALAAPPSAGPPLLTAVHTRGKGGDVKL